MKTDHLNLWERMVCLGTDRMDWDGNSTEYGLAWCEVEVDERDPETWAALPAGELKKRISDEHGEDLTYFGPGWRCVCGMVLGG